MIDYILAVEALIFSLVALGYLFPNSIARCLVNWLGEKLAIGIAFLLVATPFVLILLGWIFLGPGRNYMD